jgi:maleate isomerase
MSLAHSMLSTPEAAPSAPLDLGVLPSDLDQGIGHRASIGLIVLASDQTMEHEFRKLVTADGVALYAARLYNDNDITPETLRAVGPRIAPATELILPGIGLDVVGFGCTSATVELGEDAIFHEIRRARPGIACTTPITATLAALKAFGARRIALLTPYAPEINAGFIRFLGGRGIETAAHATFDRRDDRDAARIKPASVADGVRRLVRERQVDAVFVSCTSLRLAEVVEEIEADVGVPVMSSSHALAWHCLRLGGVSEPLLQGGRLFKLPAEA